MAIKGDIYTYPTHTDRKRLQLNKPVLGSYQHSQLLATALISGYITQCMQTIFSRQLHVYTTKFIITSTGEQAATLTTFNTKSFPYNTHTP